MQALTLIQPGAQLSATERPQPTPGPMDVLVRVHVCGLCRTDLDLAQGRLIAPHYPVTPGHQVVGTIEGTGDRVTDRQRGERVGVAWINSACGHCRWCMSGQENLCPEFRSTGCDANGGYAEYLIAPAAFVYPIPEQLPDDEAAPLLCAGAIGWRSLALTNLRDGDPLGLTGFGASAHLVLQIARKKYPKSSISVFARSDAERGFARELGADWAGDTTDEPPSALAAIIDTTPAWKPVVEAMSRLMPGGRLVINAIRKMDADRQELARLDYASALWMEREIKSVANVTRRDVQEMLAFAADTGLRPTVERRPLGEANEALATLARGGAVHGATVFSVS